MIPSLFEYERAESVDHALELLGQHGSEAKLLAGGHSLLPLMKLRLAQPSVLIDIGRLADLSYVREDGDNIAIGALTRHADLERSDVLEQHCPIVAHTAGEVGDPQVRHRGTIGGSVAHGDPASDLPTVLLTLDAQFVIRATDGERTAEAAQFFRGLFDVDLGPQEMLTEIRVPKTGAARWKYDKFHHRAQDWAIVGVAVQASNGSANVGLTTMGDRPLRARAVEDALSAGSNAAEAAQKADDGTSPPSDPFGSAEYRKHLARVLTRRALEDVLSR